MPFLRYTAPGANPRMIQITKDVTVIGRSAQADLSIPTDNNCSRNHCQVRKWAGKYILEDLNSHNGTFVNGTRVAKEHPLTDGDLISIGDTSIVFKLT